MFAFKRGDSFAFKTKVTFANSEPLRMEDVDTIFVTCKNGQGDDAIQLFQKTKDDVMLDEEGYLGVLFEPKDTETLNIGIYNFDIEITLSNGFRKSKVGSFNLEYDVTDHKGE